MPKNLKDIITTTSTQVSALLADHLKDLTHVERVGTTTGVLLSMIEASPDLSECFKESFRPERPTGGGPEVLRKIRRFNKTIERVRSGNPYATTAELGLMQEVASELSLDMIFAVISRLRDANISDQICPTGFLVIAICEFASMVDSIDSTEPVFGETCATVLLTLNKMQAEMQKAA